MASNAPVPPLPEAVYLVFCDAINQESIKRVMASLSYATQRGVKHVHLMIQSSGGGVAEGVCLYHFFKTFPIDLTVYNCGTVSSIAAIAYIAAKKRKTSASATFMIHRTTGAAQPTTAGHLHSLAESIVLDDERTDAILREHVKLSPDEWASLDKHDIWFSAEEAIKAGFADEIGDFGPPKGSEIYTT